MLTEQRRQQLDGIVRQMIENKEPDSNIQFVVSDFSQKYGNEQQPKETFMEKVAGFAGVKNISKGIAYAISPEVRKYTKESIGAKPTAKQLAGDVLQVGATIGTAGIGGAGVGLGKTALQIGGSGAVAGFGKGFSEDKNLTDSLKEAFVTGITSAGTVGVLGLAGKGISKIAQKAPERLYNDALGITQKVIQAGKSPSKKMIDEGVFGSLGSIWKQSKTAITELDNVIDKKLVNSKGIIESKKIINTAKESLYSKFSSSYGKKEIDDVISKLPISDLTNKKSLTLVEANNLRKQLDKILGESFFLSDKQAPLIKEATGILSGLLRNNVKKLSGTETEFSKLASYIRADKVVSRAIAITDKSFKLGLRDLLFGGLGGTVGGIPGIVGGVVAKKALESPYIKTGTAIGIDRINKFIQKIPTDKAGKISRTLLLNAIKEITQ